MLVTLYHHEFIEGKIWEKPLEEFPIEIRHTLFRLGKNKNCGGETIVATCRNNKPILLKSRCRPDEQFNRKFGVLTCLQRLVNIIDPGLVIDAWDRVDVSTNSWKILVSSSYTEEDKFWWSRWVGKAVM